MNKLITKVFVEQPRLHRVCSKVGAKKKDNFMQVSLVIRFFYQKEWKTKKKKKTRKEKNTVLANLHIVLALDEYHNTTNEKYSNLNT